MKTTICLLPAMMLAVLQLSAQRIEIIRPDKGFKEIDLTRPTFNRSPDPIPNAYGNYQMTHYMAVYCSNGQESGLIHQYINQTNGVVGIPQNLIKRWEAEIASIGNVDHLHYWTILPNMTQRMYVQLPETGKAIMEVTSGDGTYTTTMARFDAYMQGEIFWRTAKKIKTHTFPKGTIINTADHRSDALSVDVYEFTSEDGKVWLYLKDLGEATGGYAPMQQIYAATGVGGMGWVYNKLNNKVYLVLQILKANKPTEGCRVVALYPEKHSFAGAGYQPIGDKILNKNTEAYQDNLHSIDQNLADALNGETDAKLRALYQEKALFEKEKAEKIMKNNANAAMLNDMTELSRGAMEIALHPDIVYKTYDIDLRIAARKLDIDLQNATDPTERNRIIKNINCNRRLQTHWVNYKREGNNLKQHIKHLDPHEQAEKLGAFMQRYLQTGVQLCQ